MKWAAADITAFLADEFMGTDIIVDDGSIDGSSIRGVFESLFFAAEQYDGAVEMERPTLQVATTDVENFTEHQTRLYVAENNTDYLVTGINNNNDGWTRLILREA